MGCNHGRQSVRTLAFGGSVFMRLAFWRAGKDERQLQKAVKAGSIAAKVAPATVKAAPASGDLDLRIIWQALRRKRSWIILPTVLAAALSMSVVNLVTPRYKS